MNHEEYENKQKKRAARLLQKATGEKYTKCLRYIENLHKDEPKTHYHLFSRYGQPHILEGETIYRLRCATCGGNTFAFAVKTTTIVED